MVTNRAKGDMHEGKWTRGPWLAEEGVDRVCRLSVCIAYRPVFSGDGNDETDSMHVSSD